MIMNTDCKDETDVSSYPHMALAICVCELAQRMTRIRENPSNPCHPCSIQTKPEKHEKFITIRITIWNKCVIFLNR